MTRRTPLNLLLLASAVCGCSGSSFESATEELDVPSEPSATARPSPMPQASGSSGSPLTAHSNEDTDVTPDPIIQPLADAGQEPQVPMQDAGTFPADSDANAGAPSEPAADPRACPDAVDATGPFRLELFQELTDNVVQEIHPFFRLVNQTDEPLAVQDLQFRYYYSKEHANQPSATDRSTCIYVTGGLCERVHLAILPFVPTLPDANHYLQVSLDDFPSPLAAGEALEVRVSFHAGRLDQIQNNDYSFDPNAAPVTNGEFQYRPWERVTLHRGEELLWGREPCVEER